MFRRKRSAEDFAEEIKAHLELEADELKSEGLSEDEARRKARREFGNVRAAQERFYLKGRLAGSGQAAARSAVRLAFAAAKSGVCDHRHSDAGAGHRREHSGVQRDECGAAAIAAGERSGSPGVFADLAIRRSGTGTIDTNETFSYRRVRCAAAAKPGACRTLMAYVPLSSSKVAVRYGAEPEEAEGDMVSGNFLLRAGRESAAGPRVHRSG